MNAQKPRPPSERSNKVPRGKGASRLAPSKQTAIVAARLAGLSERKIGHVTGTSRNAVRRVLSQSEVRSIIEGYRDDLRAIVPHALNLIEHDLKIMPKKGKHTNPDS